jgi:CRISPR-associated protein Cas2
MRVMVFFDLPVETSEDRRNYSHFRGYLLADGFVKVQKSVYSKVVLNASAAKVAVDNMRKNIPPEGNVQVLTITEKQFQSIEYLLGESQKEVVDSLDRFVVL